MNESTAGAARNSESLVLTREDAGWTDVPDVTSFRLRHGDLALAGMLIAPRASLPVDDLIKELPPGQRTQALGYDNRKRFEEYVGTRWLLSRWRRQRAEQGFDEAAWPLHAISHCRSHLAVALGGGRRMAIDIESRSPRRLDAVSRHLGWPGQICDDRASQLQAWTLWEAWRKLEGGSVLDPPDRTYARLLAAAPELVRRPQHIDGCIWACGHVDVAAFSLAVEP